MKRHRSFDVIENGQSLRYRLERNSLGLELTLSLSKGRDSNHSPGLRSDDTFHSPPGTIRALFKYLVNTRPHLVDRLTSRRNLAFSIPVQDPPLQRIVNTEVPYGYFTTGELARWRFLRRRIQYPLKGYQRDGVRWLTERRAAILADDMGLGKTLQAIVAIEELLLSDVVTNALVLCPKSLIGVWEAEIRLWAPRLCTVALYTAISQKQWSTLSSQCHVSITNYESLRRERPQAGTFDLVVLDEIHRLKNPRSLGYRSIRLLNPTYMWGLSGTPLENTPRDLTTILHLLDPKRISISEQRSSPASLRSLASKYVLRRNKDVLGRELPLFTERVETVSLSPAQRNRYSETLQSAPHKTWGQWIAAFSKLVEICDYDPETLESSKADRAASIIESILIREEKVVVFSWRLQPLSILNERLSNAGHASTVATLTGQTPSTVRTSIVAAFQTHDTPAVLLCSMRATGEGLTLTAANHVLFYNEWWNPAANLQARDRVIRIGQDKDVVVYRLTTAGTVESRLVEVLEQKKALFDAIINRLSRTNLDPSILVPSGLREILEPP